MIGLILAGNGTCQVNDAGLWMNAGFEKKLNKKLSLYLSEEVRMNENISEVGTIFTETGAEYKVLKNLNISAAYRFINKRRLDDSYSKRHRYMIDASYKLKIHKLNLAVRERFQSQYNDINSSAKGHLPENYLRSKLSLKYPLRKRIETYISAEIFNQLNNPDGNEIDNERFTAGITYKISKAADLDSSYLINKEINVKNPMTSYIIGIGYFYSF